MSLFDGGSLDWDAWKLFVAVVASVVTIVVGFRTFFWRRMQVRSWLLNEQFQNDSHTLHLCQALSDASPRMRLAAAALLLERLNLNRINSNPERERVAVVQALLAATVGGPPSERHMAASPDLCKYIGDSVIGILCRNRHAKTESPLKEYYWQRVQLKGVYWFGVNARNVDFYGANFDGASLRRANLENAKFVEASLVGTKLLGTNLKNADFRRADLCDADFSDDDRRDREEKDVRATDWHGVKLMGATYNTGTKFAAGMDPVGLGMRLKSNPPVQSVA